jgi:hypothetical protein
MKKLLFGIFTCLCALIMVSCAGSSTPTSKAEAYLDDMKAGDYAAVIEHLHFKKAMTDQDKQQLATMLEEKGQKSIEKDGAIASYEIISETISEDGTTATVESLIKYEGGKEKNETIKLVNIDGKWLVESGK